MPHFALAERRESPRYSSDGLWVSVRKKGRLSHFDGPAYDFNRHGLALILDQPLAKDTTVYVCLCNGDMKLDNIIGVVHNCTGLSTGYRCGIQFRTCSEFQHDQVLTEEELKVFEACFKALQNDSK